MLYESSIYDVFDFQIPYMEEMTSNVLEKKVEGDVEKLYMKTSTNLGTYIVTQLFRNNNICILMMSLRGAMLLLLFYRQEVEMEREICGSIN